jgi:hypothetical protein
LKAEVIDMKTFEIGETVVLKVTVYKSGSLYDPVPDSGNEAEVVVYDEDGTAVLGDVTPQALSNESTGIWSYNWDTAGQTAGKYRARFTCVDGSNVTIKDGTFKLGA